MGTDPFWAKDPKIGRTLNAKAETPTAITRIIFKWLDVAPF
jgi:hypothetical protein